MRLSDLRFLLAWLLPLLTMYGIASAPAQAAIWTFAVWGGIALLDALVHGAKTSPAPLDTDSRQAWFQWLLRLYVLLQLALIALGAYAAVQADWPTVLGVAFSVGFVTGSQGITFAHELGHRKSKLDRFCAWVLMSSVCYGHFMVEHYRGHHPRAATADDPASAWCAPFRSYVAGTHVTFGFDGTQTTVIGRPGMARFEREFEQTIQGQHSLAA